MHLVPTCFVGLNHSWVRLPYLLNLIWLLFFLKIHVSLNTHLLNLIWWPMFFLKIFLTHHAFTRVFPMVNPPWWNTGACTASRSATKVQVRLREEAAASVGRLGLVDEKPLLFSWFAHEKWWFSIANCKRLPNGIYIWKTNPLVNVYSLLLKMAI